MPEAAAAAAAAAAVRSRLKVYVHTRLVCAYHQQSNPLAVLAHCL
jgi:hypothetical protein